MNAVFIALGILIGLCFTYPDIWPYFAIIVLVILLITIIQKDKFRGYVCEICGARYNHCIHSSDIDYTLIKQNRTKNC